MGYLVKIEMMWTNTVPASFEVLSVHLPVRSLNSYSTSTGQDFEPGTFRIPSKSTTHCMTVFDVKGNNGLGGSVLYYIIDNTNGMDCAFDDLSCYSADPCRFQILSRNSDGHVTICRLANSLHSCLKVVQRYYINC